MFANPGDILRRLPMATIIEQQHVHRGIGGTVQAILDKVSGEISPEEAAKLIAAAAAAEVSLIEARRLKAVAETAEAAEAASAVIAAVASALTSAASAAIILLEKQEAIREERRRKT